MKTFWFTIFLVIFISASIDANAEPVSCEGYDVYRQPFDPVWFSSTPYSDQAGGYLSYEDFVDDNGTTIQLSGTVAGMRWWGFGSVISPYGGCDDDDVANTPFDLAFYTDNGGVPGTVITTITGVVPEIVDTGVSFAGLTNILQYSATFEDTSVDGASWVSVQRQAGVASCIWNWLSESYYDSYNNKSYQTVATSWDLTVCVASGSNPLQNMNAGLNDAWFNPVTDGQGFFITVFPDFGVVSLAWFTYDTELPPVEATANLGDPGHRWLTAIGPIDGNQALMNIELTSGGIFDTATEITRTDPEGSDGTILLTFETCSSGTIEYNIPSINQQGTVPIQRIANDNIVICEALNLD